MNRFADVGAIMFQVERREVPENQAQASGKLLEVWEVAEALAIVCVFWSLPIYCRTTEEERERE